MAVCRGSGGVVSLASIAYNSIQFALKVLFSPVADTQGGGLCESGVPTPHYSACMREGDQRTTSKLFPIINTKPTPFNFSSRIMDECHVAALHI